MTQPGWYDDPDGTPGRLRYWDGVQWTGQIQAAAGPPPPQGAPSSPPRKRNPLVIVLGVLAAFALIAVVAVVGLFGMFRITGDASSGTSAPAATPAAPGSGTPAAGEPVCTAPASGQVTDGFITVGIPEGWSANPGEPAWANCGSGAYAIVTDDWISQVEVGSVSSGNGTVENVARALWDWNLAHGYLETGTVTPTISENAAVTVDGVTGWRMTGEIRVSDVEGVLGDVVTIVVLPRDKGMTSAILTVATIDDPRSTAAVAALWDSIQVTP